MTARRVHWCLAALAVLVVSGSLAAQNPAYPAQPAGSPPASPTPLPADTARRLMRASRVTSPISIDGRLNEPAWATAVPSSDFMQSYPNVGAKPTDPTEVRVLY